MNEQFESLLTNVRAVNIKTGKIYTVLSWDVINCTNSNDGRRMVLYRDEDLLFTRDYEEFIVKFKPYLDPEYKEE